jgi:hypothetical protein
VHLSKENLKVVEVADWRYEFVRGGGATTHKFIPGLSNARIRFET